LGVGIRQPHTQGISSWREKTPARGEKTLVDAVHMIC
jgi:hypothetical protein